MFGIDVPVEFRLLVRVVDSIYLLDSVPRFIESIIDPIHRISSLGRSLRLKLFGNRRLTLKPLKAKVKTEMLQSENDDQNRQTRCCCRRKYSERLKHNLFFGFHGEMRIDGGSEGPRGSRRYPGGVCVVGVGRKILKRKMKTKFAQPLF